MNRWRRYWFAAGGRYSLAVTRIAVAASVLLSLWRLMGDRPLAAPPEIYRPVGIWMLLGQTPPPELLVDALWVLAWGGAAAMLLGLCARAATAVSAIAGVALAALSYSGKLSWSHQYNVVFLANLALLGGRTGDALSLDALLRRRRGLPPRDVPRGYQWSVRLAVLAVSLMFVGAALYKIASGHVTLRWALSDNLRNHLVLRYDMSGLDRPPLVAWLLEEVWRYRMAALVNLVSQLAPLLAIASPHRRILRAIAGVFFVLEILGLGLVMELWNLSWLPLAAVFIDWDRAPGRAEAETGAQAKAWPSRGVQLFVIAFVAYEAVLSLLPGIDQRLGTYPFSRFPMFAAIRAAAPYDQHLPYVVVGDHYEVISDEPIDHVIQGWLDHHNRNLYRARDPEALRARLGQVLARAQERYVGSHIRGLRHYVALYTVPPYPEPARLVRRSLAITGELLPDGTFRSLLGRMTGTTVELRPQNLDARAARLVAFTEDRPEPRALRGTRTGDTFVVEGAGEVEGALVYVAAELDGQRWLVARRR
ncbi:MAG TPA: hypothetical protein VNO30_11165 [Kofleriaceae bacterium]|nr:hypothetical protein [Kofleriaceae bacterium]